MIFKYYIIPKGTQVFWTMKNQSVAAWNKLHKQYCFKESQRRVAMLPDEMCFLVPRHQRRLMTSGYKYMVVPARLVQMSDKKSV